MTTIGTFCLFNSIPFHSIPCFTQCQIYIATLPIIQHFHVYSRINEEKKIKKGNKVISRGGCSMKSEESKKEKTFNSQAITNIKYSTTQYS